MRRQRTAFLVAATLATCTLAFQASAERLRFEGSFNVATFSCDARAFQCLPDQWLDIAVDIAPVPFAFTIDVTQVAEQGIVFRSDTWVAPSLVPDSLISRELATPSGQRLPPFNKATFDAFVDGEYSVFRSLDAFHDGGGSLRWSAAVVNRWRGVMPPAPGPADDIDEVSFSERVFVNLQQPGAGPGGPVSFSDLIELFDHYLVSQRSVDLLAEFGHVRGDPRGPHVGAMFGRMGGSFRLVSIQCRTPSAASNLLAGLGAALRGSD